MIKETKKIYTFNSDIIHKLCEIPESTHTDFFGFNVNLDSKTTLEEKKYRLPLLPRTCSHYQQLANTCEILRKALCSSYMTRHSKRFLKSKNMALKHNLTLITLLSEDAHS